MKMPPPATARFSTPITPLAPAVWVVVIIWIDCDIQDISPASDTIFSPGFNVSSRTGSVVPWIWASMPGLLVRVPMDGVPGGIGTSGPGLQQEPVGCGDMPAAYLLDLYDTLVPAD